MLPQRIQEWSLQSCAAEATDRRSLARVREKLAGVRAALQDLERRRAALDEMVEQAKVLSPSSLQTEVGPHSQVTVLLLAILCAVLNCAVFDNNWLIPIRTNQSSNFFFKKTVKNQYFIKNIL